MRKNISISAFAAAIILPASLALSSCSSEDPSGMNREEYEDQESASAFGSKHLQCS